MPKSKRGGYAKLVTGPVGQFGKKSSSAASQKDAEVLDAVEFELAHNNPKGHSHTASSKRGLVKIALKGGVA